MTLIDWAKEHNIVLYVLPAHTSHALQPLDIGCFGPFQRIYNTQCHKFIRDNPSSKITMYNVCSLACKAYIHALSPENSNVSFKKARIYPFDPSAADHSHFVPATVFQSTNSDHQPAQHDNDLLNNQPITVQGKQTVEATEIVLMELKSSNFF